MLKKIIYLICIVTTSIQVNAQIVTMGDAGYPQSNPMNCTTFGVD